MHSRITGILQAGVQGIGQFTPHNTRGAKSEFRPCECEGMQMVGPGTAKSQQAVSACFSGPGQVVFELEPFVPRNDRVDKVETQDGQADTCRGQDWILNRLDWNVGQIPEQVCGIDALALQ